MEKYEFKVNGETFFADRQPVDAAVLLGTVAPCRLQGYRLFIFPICSIFSTEKEYV